MTKKIFTKTHVMAAAKIWDKNPGLRGFKTGTLYEVRINGKAYPPKAIASIANELANGEKLSPRDFPGALDGKWHKALAAAAPNEEFKPILKDKQNRQPVKLPRITKTMEPLDDEESFEEAKLLAKFKLHSKRERNPKVIKRAKESASSLSCAACDFDFGKTYGALGEGYIEGHHTKPIANMSADGGETKVIDIKLVCSNCHRMLHRIRPLKTVEELKKLIEEQRQLLSQTQGHRRTP
jgi:predicted HNH restriction endonuclease